MQLAGAFWNYHCTPVRIQPRSITCTWGRVLAETAGAGHISLMLICLYKLRAKSRECGPSIQPVLSIHPPLLLRQVPTLFTSLPSPTTLLSPPPAPSLSAIIIMPLLDTQAIKSRAYLIFFILLFFHPCTRLPRRGQNQ